MVFAIKVAMTPRLVLHRLLIGMGQTLLRLCRWIPMTESTAPLIYSTQITLLLKGVPIYTFLITIHAIKEQIIFQRVGLQLLEQSTE
jgi:hypothetical protein